MNGDIRNPFPGLRPFQPHENHLFFGREDQIDELISILRRRHFLAVVGTSGSGKSSLVRAGLIPALQSGYMHGESANWKIILLRPGDGPLQKLARGINMAFGERDEYYPMRASLIETTLRRSDLGLREALRQARPPENTNVLILVDQFEELFRFHEAARHRNAGSDEASAFVRLLLKSSVENQDGSVYVCLTMRSDFLGDCSLFSGLPEALNSAQYLIPRLSRNQKRRAIAGPMAVSGARMSARLLRRLLNDIGDDQDQLPILQHALMRIFDRWRSTLLYGRRKGDGPVPFEQMREIDLEDYEAVGGFQEALSRHAEELLGVIARRHSDAGIAVAEALFRRLTEMGPDNRGVRRPARFEEIPAVAHAPREVVEDIVNIYRHPSCSFIMPPPGTPLSDNVVIDISHESLMRVWSRLTTWVAAEGRSARIYRRLAETAGMHARGEAALYTGEDLNVALEWRENERPGPVWAERYGGDFEYTMQFLETSRRSRDQEQAERKARELALQEARALGEQSLVLRNIISTIPHYIFWKNQDLIYQGCNESFARAAGLEDAAQIVGRSDLELWPAEEAEKYRADDRRVMELGEPEYLEEAQTQANGETIWVATNKVPLRNSQDQVIGILGTFMDITHIKRLELQLERMSGKTVEET